MERYFTVLQDLFDLFFKVRRVARSEATRDKGLVYVSGPMRNYPDFNFPAFHAASAALRALGFAVISPAELGDHEGWSWHDYMRRDLVVVPFCSHICLLAGYEASEGASMELAVARACNAVVVYYDAKAGQVLYHGEGGVIVQPGPETQALGSSVVSGPAQ